MDSLPNSRIETLSHAGGVVKLVQLTDAHLCAAEGGTLIGMDTDHSLQQVIRRVKEERGNPELVLLTGDLSDRGASTAYVRMEEYSRGLSDACFWLPGNHDSRKAMASANLPPSCLSGEIRVGNWQILMLDSQVEGEVGGQLGDEQLALLDRALERAATEQWYTLVCLHHHPLVLGSAWLDSQRVADADAFFAIIDRYPSVRGVLWGHIHQELDVTRGQVALMGSPSTCVQFAPGTEKFKVDDRSPGYRWLDLHPDGSIETAVSRVDDVEFFVDLESDGYT